MTQLATVGDRWNNPLQEGKVMGATATLNRLADVIVSARSFEFDGRQAYSVNDRKSGRLVGHVARTRNREYSGAWVYLHLLDRRDVNGAWTMAGWSRAVAVDHLMSADNPTGLYRVEL
jgi:hypothetical protein